jgi:light-regulated signal transduction histidine kinase (bacteriophytochrome)
MERRLSEAVSLSTCDREPIHIPGSVQPHGAMLVVSLPDLLVSHVAGPVEILLGTDARPGAPLAALLGETFAARGLDLAAHRPGVSHVGQVQGSVPLDASIHRAGRVLIVELEPARPDALPASQVLDLVDEAAALFQAAASIETLCDRAAALFRRLTGFDRIMVYRFLDDGSGRVLGEARREHDHSFMHHHFPASDIPRQARALYVRNLTRVIPDVDYEPAPLRPPWDDAAPLDMSDSALRSVSPIHLQYLRNMGVAASASVSIVLDGALWGLVACHGATPRLMPYDVRAACRSVAGALARQIRAKQEAADDRQRIYLRGMEDDLLRALAREEAAGEPAAYLDDMRLMLDADGMAIIRGTELLTAGVVPSRGEIRDVAAWLLERGGEPVFATDALEALHPSATLFREYGSGLLGLVLDPDTPTVLLWFRAEQIEVIKWAGIPHKPEDDPEAALTPRASFEAWQETVRGRARAWSAPQLEAARRLRGLLLELRRGREVRALNRQLAESLREREGLLEQKDFLMGEVNHRVQNSLQLVASFLAMQGRMSTNPELRSELDEAQRRISAVALVHRRLYTGDQIKRIDAGRYVEELCADAIASMGRDWSQFLSLAVEEVPISTDRAVTLGLVMSELLININKYAYGGQAGPIEVRLAAAPAEDAFRLVVADSGAGALSPGKGFGSRMIAGMVAQLGGTLTYEDNRPGLRATLMVPREAPK